MTVEERLEEIEDTQQGILAGLADVVKAMSLLVEAVHELEPGAQLAHESLEEQHQRFKREAREAAE